MKTVLLAFTALTLLSGCVIEDLNNAVISSTYTVYSNIEAVQRSTDAIARNCALVQVANEALAENHRLLKAAE